MSEATVDTTTTSGNGGNDAATTANPDATQVTADAGTNPQAGAGEGDNTPASGEPKPTETPPEGNKAPEFVLPEEYKDKPWAAKVKSTEDLYKQIDNLNTLVGKKHAYPTADATPEQLNEYYTGLRPESAEAYDFGADHPNPDVAKQFGEMLFKSNISAHQSKQLIADYQAYEQGMIDAATSADGFKEEMTKQFGDKYDATVATVSKSLEQYASAEDQAIINAMPNKYIGSVYKLMDSVLKAHGANEGGDNLHNAKGGTVSPSLSIAEQRAGFMAELHKLEAGPHTAQQKQVIVDKIQALYK